MGTPLPLLHVYASRASHERITRRGEREVAPETIRIRQHTIGAFQRFEVATGGAIEPDPRFEVGTVPQTPARGYAVWTFAASHAEPSMEPMSLVMPLPVRT